MTALNLEEAQDCESCRADNDDYDFRAVKTRMMRWAKRVAHATI
jgi:hypothetical protein